jgi:peptide/nickel transport system ATP-binding protein
MPPLLEARHIRKVFSGGGGLFSENSETVAVDDFTLSIDADKPSFTTIAGESGSGKTTVARMLLGMISPSGGEVLYRGQDVDGLDKCAPFAKTYRPSSKILLKSTIPFTKWIIY